jgi:hypothetical protein
MSVRHLLLISVSAAVLSGAASAAELELKRVMLSAGGVGYFEYEARVNGNEALALPARLDQVDDILKSAIVFDDKGGTGTIDLQGRDTLDEIFRTSPVNREAFDSLPSLLFALKGAAISVEEPAISRARIVSVTPEYNILTSKQVHEVLERSSEDSRTGTPLTADVPIRNRVSVIDDAGRASTFVLEDAKGLAFADLTLASRVAKALEGLDANRKSNLRTLKISANGEGERTVTVGFVVSTPVWKTSYRLITKPDGKAQFQGWAILENDTGLPWNNVQLTLVAGDPITFRQELYRTYYQERDTVALQWLSKARPYADDPSEDVPYERDVIQNDANGGGVAMAPPPASPPPAPAPSTASAAPAGVGAEIADNPGISAPRRSPGAAEATASVTQITYTFPNALSASAGQSLVLPIVDKEITAERIAFMPPDYDTIYAAVRLTNETGTTLPPGAVAVYEGETGARSFAGDGLIKLIPEGDKTIMTFAADQQTRIAEDVADESVLETVRIASSQLQLVWRQRITQTYAVSAPANSPRTVIVGVNKMDGWELIEPDSASVEIAPKAIRIVTQLAAGEARDIKAVWQRSETRSQDLGDINESGLLTLSRDERLSEAQRAAFVQLAELRGAIEAQDEVIARAEEEIAALGEEQVRVRENIVALTDGDPQKRTFSEKLARLETEIEQQQTAKDAAATAREAAVAAFERFAASLNF